MREAPNSMFHDHLRRARSQDLMPQGFHLVRRFATLVAIVTPARWMRFAPAQHMAMVADSPPIAWPLKSWKRHLEWSQPHFAH